MAIYRGAGGPGDATADSASTAQLAQTYASNAAASATAAAASATAAAASESSVSTDATAAAASAAAAATSATAAASSASSASSSASSASGSSTAAAVAQLAAETAQTAAETAKTAAETAATDAENAALSATTSANAASASASSAASSASAAAAAETATLAALDSFDDRYLGAKSADPTLDNDGNALVAGAIYFNTTVSKMKVYNGSVWSLLGGGDVVDDTTPQLGGNLDTNNHHINFGDNDKATFGDSEDLWLYHDGGTSYLFDRGTGNLRIVTNSTVSIDGVSGGEFMAQFVSNGAVSLYYDNSNKFQTTSTGVNVNGTVTATGGNSGNWNTAYGWGDHSAAGYLTSYTETDPVFVASPAYGITGTKISNWDDSYTFTAAFPTQTGNSGKYLTTDGSNLSWGTVDADPAGTAVALAIALG